MDWNLLFTIGFAFGLLVIYIPQFWKIISMKTSFGFNQLFMFMGHTASFFSCLNSLIFYINNWWSCHGSLNCTESFFGFGLIVFQWLLFWVFYVLYILYHPRDRHDIVGKGCKTRKMAFAFFIISHIMILIGLVVTLVLLGTAKWHESDQNSRLMVWSGLLELVILFMFLGHYLPQLYETYQLKRVGSLSLVTLGMMCPGTFLWTIYLALQPNLANNGQDDSHQETIGMFKSQIMIWFPYLIVGIMQLVLLVIGIYYERRRKKLSKYYMVLNIDEEDRIGDHTEEEESWI